MAFFDQQLQRVRAGARTDRAGNTVRDWSPDAVDVLDIDQANVQPATRTETTTTERAPEVVSDWRVQTSPGTVPDVQAADHIIWRGRTHEVVGDIEPWTDPLDGTDHHAEWTMRRTTG